MGASVDFETLNSTVDSAEAVAEQLVLGLEDDGTDSGTGLAPCVGAARAAGIGAEQMEQVVQELEQHFELPLAFEVVCTDHHNTNDSIGGCNIEQHRLLG